MSENDVFSKGLDEKRKDVERKIIGLEKYNYNQKEYSTNEMIEKIKKIIEEGLK